MEDLARVQTASNTGVRFLQCRFLHCDEIAGATGTVAGATDATATDKNSTAGTDEGKIAIKLGDQEIKVDPKEIAEWKNAFEKKKTNADVYFTKRSQELAAKERAAAAREAQLIELINQLQNQGKTQQPGKAANILGYEGDDPEVLSAISTVEKIIEKKMGPEIEALKKSLKEREEYEARLSLAARANQIKSEAEKILNSSELDSEDKGFFVNAFLGKYDVDSIPVEDQYNQYGEVIPGLYTLFNQELKAFEASLKRRGLLANKAYVEKKAATKDKLATDTKGSSGIDSTDTSLKGLKGRDRREAKMKMLSEIVSKHLSPQK